MNVRLRSAVVVLIMLATFATGFAMTPRQGVAIGSVLLENMVPRQFGEWKTESASVVQVATELDRTTGAEIDRPVYDQVMMRTYRRDRDGATIMLALAYGREQRQELKIHRPELCYYGQGYEVADAGKRLLALGPATHIRAQALMTRNRARIEPVTYWIRIGSRISESAWQTRWEIFKEGLAGHIPDGILVRASSLVETESESESALGVQGLFLSDLYAALEPRARGVLTGE